MVGCFLIVPVGNSRRSPSKSYCSKKFNYAHNGIFKRQRYYNPLSEEKKKKVKSRATGIGCKYSEETFHLSPGRSFSSSNGLVRPRCLKGQFTDFEVGLYELLTHS